MSVMRRYVTTFGSGKVGICRGWVEVEAYDEAIVRAWARREYGPAWSGVYPVYDFVERDSQSFYPLGRLGETTLWYEAAEHVGAES